MSDQPTYPATTAGKWTRFTARYPLWCDRCGEHVPKGAEIARELRDGRQRYVCLPCRQNTPQRTTGNPE